MAKVIRLSLKFLPWYPSLAVLGYREAEHALLIAGVRGRWVDDLGVDVDIEAGSLTDQEEAQNTDRRDELEPGHLRQFCFRIFHSRWFSRKTRRSFNFFRWFHFSWKKITFAVSSFRFWSLRRQVESTWKEKKEIVNEVEYFGEPIITNNRRETRLV